MVEISVPQYLKRESRYRKTRSGISVPQNGGNLGTVKPRHEISVPQNCDGKSRYRETLSPESRFRETTGESRYHETSTRKRTVGISVPRNLVPESQYRRMVEISVPQYLKRESRYRETSFWNLGTAEWWKSRTLAGTERLLGNAGSNQAELGQELEDCLKTSVETGQNSNWNWEVARKCQQNS
ncbi:hypothetical protein RHGRI_030093 [Rhododendron griersonianum]|uniref:Uncharacterized protein n=1 Tax=Rhododendron griersonianum TaxID=479676 RepID=A0AAV6INT0_9ERIC|nr:hypothetical protein RHGRI_030093 [Rhododendron griersonianum]